MAAVWYRFRAELRTRWRGWLVLVALAGIVGGVVLAALAGARRSDSAYPRFLESQRAYDVIVVNGRGDFLPRRLVAGNLVWRAFATQLGVASETTVSVALVGALVPVVLLAANLAAAMPGRLAARTQPAIVLRSE